MTLDRLVLLALFVLLGSAGVHAAGSEGLRLEIEQALGTEADDLAKVLPDTIECIVAKQPERCGIKDFGLAEVSEQHIRTLFSGERVLVSRSGRTGAERGEIRAEFSPTKGEEVGVIYFRRVRGVWSPIHVTVALP